MEKDKIEREISFSSKGYKLTIALRSAAINKASDELGVNFRSQHTIVIIGDDDVCVCLAIPTTMEMESPFGVHESKMMYRNIKVRFLIEELIGSVDKNLLH